MKFATIGIWSIYEWS